MRVSTLSQSLDQADRAGRAIASMLQPGDLIAMVGEMGAGKTTLVRSIVAGLGGQEQSVSSPTFTIAQEYETARAVVVHVDAYRMDPEADELGPIGFDRLDDGSSIVLVEWPERLAGRVDYSATLRLTHEGETSRGIALDMPSTWQQRAGFEALMRVFDPPMQDTVCPATGKPVPADSPTWPFADERARMADLYGWFSEKYAVTRPVEQRDLEQGE